MLGGEQTQFSEANNGHIVDCEEIDGFICKTEMQTFAKCLPSVLECMMTGLQPPAVMQSVMTEAQKRDM